MPDMNLTTNPLRLLVIEDDPLLADALCAGLGGPLAEVTHAATVERARVLFLGGRFDLVILDIGLPDGSGLQLLRQWRAQGEAVPVLILTARDALDDRVRGLDLGADDYLLKPFALKELAARVRALVRRARGLSGGLLEVGPLVLDVAGKQAWLDGVLLTLSAREWALLRALTERAGRVVDKDQLIRVLCDWDEALTPNAIEVYISRLRAKLRSERLSIRTLRGLGYLLHHDE
ncbi:MAG: response regulator [Halothiobacillaceae bacterium]|nr:response regulator [Halothiobacillaceae bacterium]MDY0049323.1 response regulator [Halothiobacillaceae bacterium]